MEGQCWLDEVLMHAACSVCPSGGSITGVSLRFHLDWAASPEMQCKFMACICFVHAPRQHSAIDIMLAYLALIANPIANMAGSKLGSVLEALRLHLAPDVQHSLRSARAEEMLLLVVNTTATHLAAQVVQRTTQELLAGAAAPSVLRTASSSIHGPGAQHHTPQTAVYRSLGSALPQPRSAAGQQQQQQQSAALFNSNQSLLSPAPSTGAPGSSQISRKATSNLQTASSSNAPASAGPGAAPDVPHSNASTPRISSRWVPRLNLYCLLPIRISPSAVIHAITGKDIYLPS